MEKFITVEQWRHIAAGGTVDSGFPSPATLTAPTEPGYYTLYEEVYPNSNTHAGWKWEKDLDGGFTAGRR